jgi:hypothetical protein
LPAEDKATPPHVPLNNEALGGHFRDKVWREINSTVLLF